MKKAICLLSVLITVFCLLTVGANAYILGDVDNDFLITASDARFVLRLSVGLEECEADSDQYKAADADNNGTIAAADARLILRGSVGLEKFAENTEKNLDIITTKLPYTTNGLVVNSISEDEYYYYFNITNKTKNKDMAVSAASYIPMKRYNAKGDVIDSCNLYVNLMNYNESCNIKVRKVNNTAKLIFGAAEIDYTEAKIKLETEVINGITVPKAPFEINGIKVNKINVNTEKNILSVDMTNVSGKTMGGSVKFTCNDASGNALDNTSVSVPSFANGEKIVSEAYYDKSTSEIAFYEIKVYEATAFNVLSSSTMQYEGITFTKMPVTVNGITISFISADVTKNYPTVKLKVTNNTGKAIEGIYSGFYYKQYDKNGYVIALSRKSTESLNHGESCIAELTLEKDVSKVILGNIEVKESTALNPSKTKAIDGINTNATIDNFGGLVISDFSVKVYSNYTEINFRLTNKSGKAISEYSELTYKAVAADGTVVRTASVYPGAPLNNNEFIYKSITLNTKELKNLYFFTGEIEETTPTKESSSYTTVEGIKVTAAPYTSNGLKIDSYRYENGRIYVRIVNNTGKSVKDTSIFEYKVYGSDGRVLKYSGLCCNQMNTGESCEVYIYTNDDYAKIIFTEAVVR